MTWSAPTSDGGSPITGYKVIAYKVNGSGAVAKTFTSTLLTASARKVKATLPRGRYKFAVVALNAVGTSVQSAQTATVKAR